MIWFENMFQWDPKSRESKNMFLEVIEESQSGFSGEISEGRWPGDVQLWSVWLYFSTQRFLVVDNGPPVPASRSHTPRGLPESGHIVFLWSSRVTRVSNSRVGRVNPLPGHCQCQLAQSQSSCWEVLWTQEYAAKPLDVAMCRTGGCNRGFGGGQWILISHGFTCLHYFDSDFTWLHTFEARQAPISASMESQDRAVHTLCSFVARITTDQVSWIAWLSRQIWRRRHKTSTRTHDKLGTSHRNMCLEHSWNVESHEVPWPCASSLHWSRSACVLRGIWVPLVSSIWSFDHLSRNDTVSRERQGHSRCFKR